MVPLRLDFSSTLIWVEEQLIMSRTGHQSLDGMRKYKRIPEEQCQQVSSVQLQIAWKNHHIKIKRLN